MTHLQFWSTYFRFSYHQVPPSRSQLMHEINNMSISSHKTGTMFIAHFWCKVEEAAAQGLHLTESGMIDLLLQGFLSDCKSWYDMVISQFRLRCHEEDNMVGQPLSTVLTLQTIESAINDMDNVIHSRELLAHPQPNQPPRNNQRFPPFHCMDPRHQPNQWWDYRNHQPYANVVAPAQQQVELRCFKCNGLHHLQNCPHASQEEKDHIYLQCLGPRWHPNFRQAPHSQCNTPNTAWHPLAAR